MAGALTARETLLARRRQTVLKKALPKTRAEHEAGRISIVEGRHSSTEPASLAEQFGFSRISKKKVTLPSLPPFKEED